MEFYELTIRIPRPSRSWFRYRVRTLLLLMLLIAIGATIWRVRATGHHQRLLQKLEQVKANRDAALREWKSAVLVKKQGGNADNDEATARAQYFEHRAHIENLLHQIDAESG